MQIQPRKSNKVINNSHKTNLENKINYKGMSVSSSNERMRVKLQIPPSPPKQDWSKYIKDSLGSGHSLHELYHFQHLSIIAAAEVMKKVNQSNDVLTTLANQMDFAKIKDDRPTTSKERKAASHLVEELIQLLASEYQKSAHSYSKSDAIAIATAAYKSSRIDILNNSEWKTIKNKLEDGENKYTSIQCPAAEMKIYEGNDIFKVPYNGKGVCSWSTDNIHHATNLWNSTLTVEGINKQQHILFSGIRHGVLSPYKLELGSNKRSAGAEARAREVVTAALYSKPELFSQALEGKVVPLRLVSTSLLTATNIFSKEGEMLHDQMQAWQKLKTKSPITLQVRDRQGHEKNITVDLDIAAMNFGVNELALKFGLGNKQSDKYNIVALEQLLGKDLNIHSALGGWVGEYLAQNPLNSIKVQELSHQLKKIWSDKSHHSDGGEPYKIAQRVSMLAYEIGAVPCWNCKSGKDRTGMLDVELKQEAISQYQGNSASIPNAPLDYSGRKRLQQVLMNSGNLEIQRYNTGGPGNKVIKDFPGVSLSYKQRISDANAWSSAKGLSSLIKS